MNDYTKELIAFLKFWLGILVISNISLIAWLFSVTEKQTDLKILVVESILFFMIFISLFLNSVIYRIILKHQ